MYDLLKGTGGEIDRKVNVVYAIQAVKGVGLGIWTLQAAKNTLNAMLTADGKAAMDATEEAEFDAICAALNGKPDTTQKLVYINAVEASFFAAELGRITEATFKAILEIN